MHIYIDISIHDNIINSISIPYVAHATFIYCFIIICLKSLKIVF